MRLVRVCLVLLAVGCTASTDTTGDPDPIVPDPASDASVPVAEADARPAPHPGGLPAGAACATGDQCAGGSCLGAPGQPEDGNNRFAGGYCTGIGCTPNTQEGCGADEICVE